MKRFFPLLAMVLVMLLGMAGCGSGGGGTTPAPASAPPAASGGAAAADTPAASGGTAAPAASGTDFPTKPVNIIVGFSAGGGTDTAIRAIQPYLKEALGTTVNIENRAGAGAAVARNYTWDQPADGYTVYASVSSDVMFTKVYKDSQTYDDFFTDFIPVSSWSNNDGTMVLTGIDSPIKTFDQLIEEAKNRTIKFGISAGFGSSHHGVALVIEKEFGVKWDYIPYKSSAELTIALRSGEVDAGGLGVMTDALDLSHFNFLGMSTLTRVENFPDVPTFTELGYPEIELPFSCGAWVKRGTPEEVIAKLEAAFEEAFYSDGYQGWATELKKPIGDFYNREKWTSYLKDYDAKTSDIIPAMVESMGSAAN